MKMFAVFTKKPKPSLARGIAGRISRVVRGSTAASEPYDPEEFGALTDVDLDVRHGFRKLHRDPKYTLAIVVMLALGTGLNAVMVAGVDSILFKPYPGVVQGEALMEVAFFRSSFQEADWVEFVATQQAFQSVGAVSRRQVPVDLGQGAVTTFLGIGRAQYFETMRYEYHLGRDLTNSTSDDRSAVVSYRFWQEQLDGSPSAIGRSLLVRGVPLTVVGVLSELVPGSVGVWVTEASAKALEPASDDPSARRWRFSSLSSFVGRMHPDRSLGSTREEVRAMATTIGFTGSSRGPLARASVHPLLPLARPEYAVGMAFIASIGTLLVLGIACANASLLLVGRALARKREIAMRFALGASSDRILRQLVVEGVVIATLAVMMGLLIIAVLAEFVTFSIYDHVLDLAPSWRTVAAGIGLALAAGIGFSLAPAINVADGNLRGALADAAAGFHRSSSQMQRGLVILQFTLATAAAYITLDLVNLARGWISQDVGYEVSDRVLMAEVAYESGDFTDEEAYSLAATVQNRLRSVPAVQSVSYSSGTPGGSPASFLNLDGGSSFRVREVRIGADYFETLSIPIVDGRSIEESDRLGTQRVIVLSEDLANDLWPGQSAVGRTLEYYRIRRTQPPPARSERVLESAVVVGVAGGVPRDISPEDRDSTIYAAAVQAEERSQIPSAVLFARSDGSDARNLAGALQREIVRAHPDLPIRSIRTTREHREERYDDDRSMEILFGTIGLVALTLAAGGAYATVVLSLAQRRREIAIRRALGASNRRIIELTVSRGIALAAVGIGIGMAVGFVVTLLLGTHFKIEPLGLKMTVLVIGTLAIMALLASFIPSLGAIRAQPMESLRD